MNEISDLGRQVIRIQLNAYLEDKAAWYRMDTMVESFVKTYGFVDVDELLEEEPENFAQFLASHLIF